MFKIYTKYMELFAVRSCGAFRSFRKICAAAETDRKMLSDTVLELGFKAPEVPAVSAIV
jgi:hypothetical protein